MAELANGIYFVVSALNTSLVLDVAGASTGNGANVQVYTRNNSNAQIWRITKEGTAYQILSRYTGRSLDVAGAGVANGTNIQMWTDNDSRAQRWRITDTGATKTVAGKVLSVYDVVNVNANKSMDVAGGGTKPATNVQVWAKNNTDAQRWIFLPVEPFRSGGVYEIRSRMDTRMALDVASASRNDGANIRIWSASGSNAQRFVLFDEGNGWSIRNVNSNKCVDVAAGKVGTNGANVQQYADNDSRAQRWAITTYGTVTCCGKTCQVVRFGAGNANSKVMDVAGASTGKGTNVQIYTDNGSNAQRFVLVPVDVADTTMPVPYELRWSSAVGAAGYASMTEQVGTLFPTWKCADAWVTSGPNSYQYRWRKRYMRSSNSTWTAWTAWTAWDNASVTIRGNQAWLTNGVDVSYSIDDYKDMEYALEVRTLGTGNNRNIHGPTAAATLRAIWMPTVTLGTDAGWAPDGLHISYESDYPYGVNRIIVKQVVVTDHHGDHKRLTHSPNVTLTGDSSSSITIPADKISVPADGSTVQVTYQIGNDRFSVSGATFTATLTANWTTGTVTVSPTIGEGAYRTLRVSVPHIGTERLWMDCGGVVREVPGNVIGGQAVFLADPPFGRAVSLHVMSRSGDSDNWGTWYGAFDADDPRLGSPCHVWTWETGGLVLEQRPAASSDIAQTLEATNTAHQLNARAHETVTFSGLVKSSFRVDGYIDEDEARDALTELVGRHAWYRGPTGIACDVAVVSADPSTRFGRTKVTVSMIEETV